VSTATSKKRWALGDYNNNDSDNDSSHPRRNPLGDLALTTATPGTWRTMMTTTITTGAMTKTAMTRVMMTTIMTGVMMIEMISSPMTPSIS
jgi:hypothetical protein